jgi:protein kinase C-binding protein NELL
MCIFFNYTVDSFVTLVSRAVSDVDECREKGGQSGHFCGANTVCKNTLGSYKCECLPGYKRVDRLNCKEHNECSSGEHKCHPHATCTNTEGSYSCRCNEGYAGDGFHCKREHALS